jgi:photosystem II stability/assembly factor-like uncharacterized protein
MKSLTIFCLLIIFFSSCYKEKSTAVQFIEIQLPTDFDLNNVYQDSDSSIWVAAGNRFGRGAVYHSPNYGINWYLMLDADFEVRSLRFKGNRIYAVTIGNLLYWSDNNGQSWSNVFMLGWEYFSAVDVFSDFNTLLIGGENFGRGIIHHLNTGSNPNFINADTIQHELTDIHILNDSVIIAVGYGVILKSNNRGLNWIPDKARGDFFKALSFPDSLNGYVVGNFGSIYKTIDAGINWKKLKSSNTFFNSKNRFNSVFFIDNQNGVLCGKNGNIWITENAAESWIPINNLKDNDFNGVFMNHNHILAAAKGAKLFIIDRPK